MEDSCDPTRPRVPAEADTDGARTVRPDLLVVGGTGRNSGKTELACRLIGLHAPSIPVVGLKVTSVERTDAPCPHGGEGCGVCSSLTQPWIVTRETDRTSSKDTCRMLASGARRVYWLRALRSELAGAASELLSHVPPGWFGVCEATSLRRLVEPGLFLLVHRENGDGSKPSARAVAHLADRMVVSDGRSFDIDLDRISVVNHRWVLRREGSAVVIDGGAERSGPDRGAALRGTRASLAPQFDRVVTVVPGEVGPGGAPLLPGEFPETPAEWCLVTPPLPDGVPPGLVNRLFRSRSEADVVVASPPGGLDLYVLICRRSLLADVIAARGWTVGAVSALRERCKVRELPQEATRLAAGP